MPKVENDQWAAPIAVTDVDLAFPAIAMRLMPSQYDCEAGLNELPDKGKSWREFQHRWFFHGLPDTITFGMAPGVDGEMAIRHLSVIQGSFAPKHQHKEAAVAYLASRWFVSVDYGDDS